MSLTPGSTGQPGFRTSCPSWSGKLVPGVLRLVEPNCLKMALPCAHMFCTSTSISTDLCLCSHGKQGRNFYNHKYSWKLRMCCFSWGWKMVSWSQPRCAPSRVRGCHVQGSGRAGCPQCWWGPGPTSVLVAAAGATSSHPSSCVPPCFIFFFNFAKLSYNEMCRSSVNDLVSFDSIYPWNQHYNQEHFHPHPNNNL